MNRLIVGLAGHPGAGKSVCGEYLAAEHGFAVFSGSTYLKTEAAKLGRVLSTREDYSNFQRELRVERSSTFVTDLTLELPNDKIVNVGIRNKLDVSKFQHMGGIIIALDCPLEVRFERTAGTNSKYPTDFNEYLAAEEGQYDSPDPLAQHTQWTMDRADYTIDTTQPITSVFTKLDEIVHSLIS